MTSRQDSTFDDQTELLTTDPVEINQQTTGSSMTSMSSRGALLLLFLALVGAAANALVLYALVASKQHEKHALIFNQNLLDFVSCFFLVISNALKVDNIYLSGTLGYWLCMIVLSELFSYGAFHGSVINLAAITVERYLKVVHAVWAKKLQNWMIYSTVAFAWIAGVVVAVAMIFPTSSVVDGACLMGVFSSHQAQLAYWIWYILSFYVVILLIFIFCYGRILMAIRHQAQVMVAHSATGSSTAQTQSKQIQTNVIKTMILVSVLFAVSWVPVYIYVLDLLINGKNPNLAADSLRRYAAMSVTYLYNCINPFIYATKFDPVRRILLRLIPCKKTTQPVAVNLS